METFKCNSCKSEVCDSDKFCKSCGLPFMDSVSQDSLEKALLGIIKQFKPKDAGKVVLQVLQSIAMRTESPEDFRKEIKKGL